MSTGPSEDYPKLKAAAVGAGLYGEVNLRAGQREPRVELVRVWSRSEQREATYQDMINFARLRDALDSFDIANNCVQSLAIPESVVHAVWLQTLYENTGKPFCCWYAKSQQVAEETLEVASAAAGELDVSELDIMVPTEGA